MGESWLISERSGQEQAVKKFKKILSRYVSCFVVVIAMFMSPFL